ncbi:MAG: flagellar hook basal-body protein [Bryobacteraceae bacterium]
MATPLLAIHLHSFPPMDALLTSAASGMKARMESLEMLANNLANQGSPGYKSDREFYSLYIAPEALDGTGADVIPLPPAVPLVERHWTDFSQGSLEETGNPLQAALTGRGFFTVQGPSGPLYTRNGSFRTSPDGGLETQDGYPVLDDQNKPVRIDPSLPVTLTSAGDIRQSGRRIGRLGLVDFAQPEGLAKRSGTYFQWNGPAGAVSAPPAATQLHQGRLERSNQPAAEGAIRLITLMRQFEMLQRAIQVGSEMNRRADEVARPGQ